MSRIANSPIEVPGGVEVALDGQHVVVKGAKGALQLTAHPDVALEVGEGEVRVRPRSENKFARSMAGTTRALVNNMVTGVSAGFERRLELQGVGYRAQAKDRSLNLTLGYSHPVDYEIPEGIEVETPSNTEIVVRGVDKQLVGQVSAEIRGFRPPEPYKGKGVRYAGERVRRKEAKKK